MERRRRLRRGFLPGLRRGSGLVPLPEEREPQGSVPARVSGRPPARLGHERSVPGLPCRSQPPTFGGAVGAALADADPAAPDERALRLALERAGGPVAGPAVPRSLTPAPKAGRATLGQQEQVEALRRELAIRDGFAVEVEWQRVRLAEDVERLVHERAELVGELETSQADRRALELERDEARRQRERARLQRDETLRVLEAFEQRLSTRLANKAAATVRRVPGGALLARLLRKLV